MIQPRSIVKIADIPKFKPDIISTKVLAGIVISPGFSTSTLINLIIPISKLVADNLSLAPAIEYNWNENLGVLGGAQFSGYGKNSANFITGQFSVVYTW